MADKYTNCESVYQFAKELCKEKETGAYAKGYNNALHAIMSVARLEAFPAADVREVVTCEECVWHIDDGTHYCNKWCEPCPDNAEFFCAYGERDNRGADMRGVDDG